MAQKIKDSSELWELERHLAKRRKEIDAKYEYLLDKVEAIRLGDPEAIFDSAVKGLPAFDFSFGCAAISSRFSTS